MTFPLSNAVNPPCVFIVQHNHLRGRLDAEYNKALLSTFINSRFPGRKIREIASCRTGGTPSKSRMDFWEGDIPWASPKDFGSFYLTETIDHISKAAVKGSSTTLIPAGALLIVFRSGVLQHTLPVAITTRETAINQDLKALIFSGEASSEYVGAYFVIFGRRLLALITKSGATVQSINTEQFEELGIPIPPRQIQDCIVKKLVSAYLQRDEVETKAKQLLLSIDNVLFEELGISRKPEMANTIGSRVFNSTFSKVTAHRWDPLFHQGDIFHFIREAKCNLVRLGDLVSHFLTGFAAGRGDQSDEGGAVIQIRPTNISNDRELVFNRNVTIASAELKTRRVDVLNRGEVLFNNTNSQEQVGKTVYFDLQEDYFCSNHITRITSKGDQLNARYLGYVLNLYQRKKVFFRLCTNWNNQSGVGVDMLEKIPIPLPNPKHQALIVSKLENIRDKARKFRLQAIEELQQAKTEIEALILGKETNQ